MMILCILRSIYWLGASKCSLLLLLPYSHGALVLQSLLLLVEDANDNPPLFIQPPTSVTVKESGAYQLKDYGQGYPL
jgi:hypothetical protein